MFRVTTQDLNNVAKGEDGQVDESKDFFAKETNLTVSGQLNAEAYALAFRDVYTFGPTLPVEKTQTQLVTQRSSGWLSLRLHSLN